MKIAVNARFLLSGRLEGIGWYTHEIVRRMVQLHPNDEFLFFFDRPYSQAFIYGPNVTPIVLFPPARHPILWYWWFEISVAKALRQHQPDVFFSPDSFLSLRANTPTVMTVHDLVPLHHPEQVAFKHRHYLLHYLPKFVRRADHILTVSDYVRHDIAQTCNLDLSKITVAYNACRSSFMPLQDIEKEEVKQKFSEGQDYFFYTGAIHPRKNIPRLIRAFDAFKNRTHAPLKLLLAGRFAWQTGEVTAAFEVAQHRADIHFLDYVSEADLPRLTAAATALTYLSLSEGFGLPMLEAMYCDTPLLAANATCLPEIAGDAALLVDPLSEADIADGMEKLWENPDLAEKLVEKGRIQRQKFSWDRAAEQVYVLLERTALLNE
jgi:glycosyltransferase involved in cell wall biosynthesis